MAKKKEEALHVLSVDIGGSHIKAALLDRKGAVIYPYTKVAAPEPATPEHVITAIQQLVSGFPPFDRISVGFPGYVKEGTVMTAPNLGTEHWAGTNLETKLTKAMGKPARVVNDADMQGLGIASGKGLELVITLGTGFGSALLYNGALLPHLEMAHHPITKQKDYDQYIGDQALADIGVERWLRRMDRVLAILKTVFNYDTLYISGGNARLLRPDKNDPVRLVSNKDGIRGGARLWTGAASR